ncbi:EamA family transporter [Lewinella sp. W8]|nr:EamA family transporter [Lewinella sp. W8]
MIFIGTSGVLGRFVPLAPIEAVWWRAIIALGLLGAFCWWKGYTFRLRGWKRTGMVLLAGLLMAGHWVTYFYALQLSSVAIGMLSIFTFPAMTTLLEPLLLRKPFEPRHLLLAALVVAGVYFLAPSFSLEDGATLGLLFGLLSAFIYSLRNILLKTQVNAVQGSVLMFYQVVVTGIALLPILSYGSLGPRPEAWPYLIGLGVFTTAIGHTLFLGSFRHFSVSTASLLACVQPVYGILLGVVFFREIPGPSSLLGGALILLAVVVEARKTVGAKPTKG